MACMPKPPCIHGSLFRRFGSCSAGRMAILFLLWSLWILLLNHTWSPNALAEETISADTLMEQGQLSYQQGAFTQALQYWTEAGRRYEMDGKAREQIKAQGSLSQALYQTGHYKEAGAILTASGKLADQIGDRLLTGTIKGRLGTILFVLGDNEQALRTTDEGLAIARDLNYPALTATILNDQGNILAAEKRFSSAVAAYTESSTLAKASNQQALATIALINSARATIQAGSLPDAKAKLDLAAQEILSAPDSHDKANAWITLGDAYEEMLRPRVSETSAKHEVQRPLLFAQRSRGAEIQPEGVSPSDEPVSKETPPDDRIPTPFTDKQAELDQPILRLAAGSYWNAIQIATRIGDSRSESYGWGHLGHVYEVLNRPDEALDLTRRALLAAQKVRSPESLYRWHWQTARLLRSKGRIDEAILAYQRAIETLQPIRSEFLVGSRNRQFSFRETTGDLFFELSDLLLQRASSAPDRATRQHLLAQAQDTVELYKAAELQDYFRDECVATARSRSTEVAQESHTTAIIYPIILPDRLELLVSLPTGLKQFIVPIIQRPPDRRNTFVQARPRKTDQQRLSSSRPEVL